MQRSLCRIRRRNYFLSGKFSAASLLIPHFHSSLRLQASDITQTRWTTSISDTSPTGSGTSSTANTDTQVVPELLGRSQLYGLKNIEDLHRESRLAPLDKVGTYLVDRPAYRFELPLWEILLDYQVRRHGPQSVRTIWHGLKFRGQPVILTADDIPTTSLWLKLLKAAVQSEDLYLLKILCSRDSIAWNRSKLFAEVISTCLKYGDEDQALTMIAYLRPRRLIEKSSVLDFYNVLEPKDRTELKHFIQFSPHFGHEKIYGKIIPRIWAKRGYQDAILTHNVLIAKGDFPSSVEEIKPFLEFFAENRQSATRFLQKMKDSGASFMSQAHNIYGDAVAQNENSQTSKRRWLSDSFAARLFATKTLSFDFVLNSLLLFSSVNIGPQSLREIGLSASNLETFSSRLSRLDELHIDTGSHAYSRMLRKLCSTKQETLLRSALETTMHHDVFEDVILLQRLLLENFNKGDWQQVNLLLAILNNGEVVNRDIHARQQILDLLSFEEDKERLLLTLCPDNIANHGEQDLELTRLALDCFAFIGFPENIQAKQVKSKVRRMKFLTGILQNSMATGKHVPVHQWAPVLSLLRKLGNLSDTIALSLWIARRYLAPIKGAQYHSGGISMLLLRPRRLLGARYQRLLVSKALRKDMSIGLSKTQWRNLRLVLKFLKHLETKYAMTIDLKTMRRVIATDLRGNLIKARSYRAVSDKYSLDVWARATLVKLMAIVHKTWASPVPVLEREVELALETLKDRKRFFGSTLYQGSY